MKILKEEMDTLQEAEPPKAYPIGQIETRLNALKNAPDEKVIHLLIERIDVESKTDFNIFSTLKSVVGENGCGGEI